MISPLLCKYGTPPLGGDSPNQLYGWLVAYKAHIHWGMGPTELEGFIPAEVDVAQRFYKSLFTLVL